MTRCDNADNAAAVLDFWFGDLDEHGLSAPEVVATWWTKDDEFDNSIRERFGELHKQASSGELDSWLADDESAFALLIVLDQFSRNLFRNSPRMVSQDTAAIAIARELIQRGADKRFPAAWRGFAYLPFEHSESIEDQTRSVALFEAMRDESAGPAAKAAQAQVEFAIKHQVIIERFGRFPHRNAFLNRESTAEEIEFLEQPGSSF